MIGRSSKVYSLDDTEEDQEPSRDKMELHERRTPSPVGLAGARRDALPAQEVNDTLNRTLHQCARDGDVDSLNTLMGILADRKKKAINKLDENKMTPLHYAARYNHFKIVEALLKHGAAIQYEGEDRQTALHFAAKFRKAKQIRKTQTVESNLNDTGDGDNSADSFVQSGPQELRVSNHEDTSEAEDSPEDNTPMLSHKEATNDSLNSNGSATIVLGEDGDGNEGLSRRQLRPLRNAPLPASDSTEHMTDFDSYQVPSDSVIAYLVKHGANVNAKDIYGSTPLHFAAMRSNETALLELLCQPGIDIEAVDKQRMTALHLAATHDNVESCRLLILKGAQLRVTDDEKSTPVHMAATEGNVEVIKMLFEEAERRSGYPFVQSLVTDLDYEGNTPLHLAVENGHTEVVRILLEKGATVSQPRDKSITPLHLAANSGDVSIVKLLVEKRARIDALDADQSTPLHKAAALNNYEAVRYLVTRGARLEKADKDNFTPLLIAASFGHVETLKVLLELGANVFAVDKNEKTAMHWACEEDHLDVLRELLEHKGGKNLMGENDRYGYIPLHIAARRGFADCVDLMLQFGADFEDKTDEEQTPLHLAAFYGKTNVVRALVKHDRAMVNDYDENSNTPLHLAALEGHVEAAAVLLNSNADIIARNCNLWTPIDCAAAHGHIKVIKKLLEFDSPVDPTDRSKTTPLHLASSRGHADCVKLLIERGASVNVKNADGYNCMDLAIDNAHKDVVMTILNSDKWMEAMKHAHLDLNAGGMRVTPIRKLIRKMPEVAEHVFNKCTKSNDQSPESVNFSITFNYELLDDQYASWDNSDGSSRSDTSSLYGGSVYNDDNTVNADARAYSNKSVIKKNHPLLIMVKSKREDLLAHPLVTSLLRHKWHTVGRYFYYANLLTYALYLIFFTGFALVLPSPYSVVTKGFTEGDLNSYLNASCAAQENAAANSAIPAHQMLSRKIFVDIGKWIIFIIIGIKLFIEILQLINSKLSYFGWENLLEWILYVSSLLFLIPFSSDCRFYREVWQWQVGVIAVFLAWMELVLIIRKLPRLGIYVVMFTHILYSFMEFFIVFFLFLVGFAISFYMALSNQTSFATVENSLLKTAVMMIGEFDYGSIFDSAPDPVVLYKEAAYILFVLFFVIMTILIMNLLVGLAVDDIKGVQEQAVLTRMAMQVELALTFESLLPEYITRRHIMKQLKIKPNAHKNNCCLGCCLGTAGSVISGLSSNNITAALNPDLDDMEKVMEEQEKLQVKLTKLSVITKQIQSQNAKLEAMLKALLEHNKIDTLAIDDEDDDI